LRALTPDSYIYPTCSPCIYIAFIDAYIMKQKALIWNMMCALLLSASMLGITVSGENAGNAAQNKGLLIWEFAPNCANGLEYVVLKNSANAVCLAGFVLTDGEGKVVFGDVVVPAYGQIVIANNGSKYMEYFESLPDVDLASRTNVTVSGLFKLANTNDELYLYSPDGSLIDAVGYGKFREINGWKGKMLDVPEMGTIYKRKSVEDTNTADDWLCTKLGRTAMSVRAFRNVNLRAYVTPDAGLDALLDVINTAKAEILVCSYSLDSPHIVMALENASRRNVSISVLIESSPAGGIAEREMWAYATLSKFANVSFYGTPAHARFDYMHAKYMVVDRRTAVVSTENFKASSFPERGLVGTRGWGVVLEDAPVAEYLAEIFHADLKSIYGDVGSMTFTATSQMMTEACVNYTISNFTCRNSSGNVWIALAPDNALDFVLRAIGSAEKSVCIEALSMSLHWGTSMSPFVDAIAELGAQGVDVRVLLDGSMENAKVNRETIEYLNALGLQNVHAKIVDNREHGFRMTHTKGIIIDERYVYLGSTNLCYNSFNENREIGVLVESGEINRYLSTVFAFDWRDDFQAPHVYIGMPSKCVAGTEVRFDASGTSDNGRIVDYLWDFDGDGNIDARGVVVRHTYAKVGRYLVNLTVVDAEGNVNSTVREITVSACDTSATREAISQNWIYALVPIAICVVLAVKFGKLGEKTQNAFHKIGRRVL